MTRKAQIITVANQKGGVGKTTSTMNLGVALSKKGLKVLLVDNDPQANLTSYLGVTPGEAPFEGLRTIDEVYLSKRPLKKGALAEFLTETEAGPFLLAGDGALSGVEYYLFSKSDKELTLSHFFASIVDQFDVILVDTPPSLNLLTLNALCASDHVLIPVQPEFFSLEGIVKIRQIIEEVKSRWRPSLNVIGILPTQVSARRKLTTEVLEALQGELADLMFETRIHDSAAVTESSGHAKAVVDYQKSSRGAKDYLAAADELHERLQKFLD